MADSALVRTARALDLIPYVVEHSGLTVEELAKKFNTTEVEISETLNTLFMCGLPGYTHLELIDLTTEDGFVSVIDPQNLNKPRKLSQQEVVSLILGLENLRLFSQGATTPLIDSVREKLSRLLDRMDVLSQIEIVPQHEPVMWIPALEEAISGKRCVDIEYRAIGNDSVATRSISPRRLYGRNGIFYLEALNESGFLRHFRIDRISKVSESTSSYINDIKADNPDELKVEILIPRGALKFLESADGMIESLEIIGEMRKVSMKAAHTQWLLRALSAIPGKVTILQPESLRLEFQESSRAALSNYL